MTVTILTSCILPIPSKILQIHIRNNHKCPSRSCDFNTNVISIDSKFTNFTHSLLLSCTPSELPSPSICSAPCCIQDQTQNSCDKVNERVTQGSDYYNVTTCYLIANCSIDRKGSLSLIYALENSFCGHIHDRSGLYVDVDEYAFLTLNQNFHSFFVGRIFFRVEPRKIVI